MTTDWMEEFRLFADVNGKKWPKRRWRTIDDRVVLTVVPRRERLKIRQRPHPRLAWAAERSLEARADALIREWVIYSGGNPDSDVVSCRQVAARWILVSGRSVPAGVAEALRRWAGLTEVLAKEESP